jgi:DNA-binding transcriptional ArsR family regulator
VNLQRKSSEVPGGCCPRQPVPPPPEPLPLPDIGQRRRYELRCRVIKALAHPTRLYIVERLAEREHCVCELTALIGADISTVSKHLSQLTAAGVCAQEKRGSQVWYRLRVPCVLNFIGCVEAVLEQGL